MKQNMKTLIDALKGSKRIYIQVNLFIIVILAASCESALDIDADNNISGDVFANEENIKSALVGAYFNLGGIYDGVEGGELFGGDFMLIPMLFVAQNVSEVLWDRSEGPQYTDFIDNEVINTNLRIESSWRRAYEVINLLNNVIKNIDNVTTERDRIEGEALAMRGILYFEMIRLWGAEYDAATLNNTSIPLITEPFEEVSDIQTPTLATINAIYTKVEEDLSAAAALLQPLGKNGVNISYYTCQAYLMRHAMHKGDYAAAETFANEILDQGQASSVFSLTSSPLDAFNNFSNSTEDIFAIQQTQTNNAGDITTGSGITNFTSSLAGKGIGALRLQGGSFTNLSTLINRPKFTPDDIRGIRDLTMDNENYTPESVTTAFYTHITSSNTFSPSKFMSADRVIPVVRLAEIYLARAEAIYEQAPSISDEAIADLNEIRTRSNISALQSSDFVSADALLDSIKIEKKREFLYEGLIFHDLKRWNDGIGNPAVPATDPKFILPIPQSETDTW